MHLFLDICQGIGLACAVGIRPFLPALLAGAFAVDDLGVDFDGTNYHFLEEPWFLLILVIGAILLVMAERRLGAETVERPPLGYGLAAVSVVLAVLLFAGSLADRGEAQWPAIFAVGIAALTYTAIRSLLTRTRGRLDAAAAVALPVYAEAAGLLAAALSIALPPFGLVVLLFVAALALTGRRREGQKYAGLRILR